MSSVHKRFTRATRSSGGPNSQHPNQQQQTTNRTSSPSTGGPQTTTNTEGNDENGDSSAYMPLPKHMPFPDVPHSSEFFNELFIFLLTVLAGATQFIHLYRTVWWLPESYTNKTVNLYLIDTYLVVFIVVIIGRRLLFCIICKVMNLLLPDRLQKSAYLIYRFVFLDLLILVLGGCTVKIFQNHSYVYTICLCYPLIVYAVIFGFRIEPFLRTINESDTAYFNQIPLHSCSTAPAAVRTEVDNLIVDFNKRFKQVIFTSVLNAYYAGFIPCFFAQKFLYYNVYWTVQHLAFIFIGVFAMNIIYCFPAKYADILHRSSLHLGQWTRVENSLSFTNGGGSVPVIWSKSNFWPAGSLVKHSEKVYKSKGHITSAIPSNPSHYRFFLIFHNPSLLYFILAILQLTIIVIQISILYFFAFEWHNLISLSFLLFVNNTSLFKLLRDYLVTHKIYTAESSIYKKISTMSASVN